MNYGKYHIVTQTTSHKIAKILTTKKLKVLKINLISGAESFLVEYHL